MLAILLAIGASAHATDDQSAEGVFRNNGPSPLYCFKDTEKPEWAICYRRLARGATCRADAVGRSVDGPVYKIPNHSQFNCTAPTNESPPPPSAAACNAADTLSALTMRIAKLRRKDGYEHMSFDHFYNLMTGNRPRGEVAVRPCDMEAPATFVPNPDHCPYPEPFHREARALDKIAELVESVERPDRADGPAGLRFPNQ